MANRKDFFGWWTKKERTFTPAEVKDLLEKIKQFNAGAIDPYLTKHVDNAFKEWASSLED